MKLFFKPGACSLASHIVAREAGLGDVAIEKVDTKAGRTESGADWRALNPKGYVPALLLEDGQLLTEGAVIVQYLADRKPGARLVPPAGSLERYRVQEWLNYIATEVHKTFSPLFSRATPEEWKAKMRENLGARFDLLSRALEGRDFLMGAQFSVADAYLYTVLRWTKPIDFELARWPALGAYLERCAKRPGVAKALQEEGLT